MTEFSKDDLNVEETPVYIVPKGTVHNKIHHNRVATTQYIGDIDTQKVPKKIVKKIQEGKIVGGRVVPYMEDGWKRIIYVEKNEWAPVEDSLTHELVHAEHPDWGEKKVENFVGEGIKNKKMVTEKKLDDIGYEIEKGKPKTIYATSLDTGKRVVVKNAIPVKLKKVEEDEVATSDGKFRLVHSNLVQSVGDVDLRKKQILIHKDMPRKFDDGIAVHEIEERKWIDKGHSYNYSHQKAQEKELDFYKSKFGNEREAKSFLNEEEQHVNRILLNDARLNTGDGKTITADSDLMSGVSSFFSKVSSAISPPSPPKQTTTTTTTTTPTTTRAITPTTTVSTPTLVSITPTTIPKVTTTTSTVAKVTSGVESVAKGLSDASARAAEALQAAVPTHTHTGGVSYPTPMPTPTSTIPTPSVQQAIADLSKYAKPTVTPVTTIPTPTTITKTSVPGLTGGFPVTPMPKLVAPTVTTTTLPSPTFVATTTGAMQITPPSVKLTESQRKALADNPGLTYSISPMGEVVLHYPTKLPVFESGTSDIMGMARIAVPAGVPTTTALPSVTVPTPSVPTTDFAAAFSRAYTSITGGKAPLVTSTLPEGPVTPTVTTLPTLPTTFKVPEIIFKTKYEGGAVGVLPTGEGVYTTSIGLPGKVTQITELPKEFKSSDIIKPPELPRLGKSFDQVFGKDLSPEMLVNINSTKARIDAGIKEGYKAIDYRILTDDKGNPIKGYLDDKGNIIKDDTSGYIVSGVIRPEKFTDVGKDLFKATAYARELGLKEGEYSLFKDPVTGNLDLVTSRAVPDQIIADIKIGGYAVVDTKGFRRDAIEKYLIDKDLLQKVETPSELMGIPKGLKDIVIGDKYTYTFKPNVQEIIDKDTGERRLIVGDITGLTSSKLGDSISKVQSDIDAETARIKGGVSELKREFMYGTPLEKIGSAGIITGAPLLSPTDYLGLTTIGAVLKDVYKGKTITEMMQDVTNIRERALEDIVARTGPGTNILNFIWQAPMVQVAGTYALGTGISTGVSAWGPKLATELTYGVGVPPIVEAAGGVVAGGIKLLGSPIGMGTMIGVPAAFKISRGIYYKQPFEDIFGGVASDVLKFELARAGVRAGAVEGAKLGREYESKLVSEYVTGPEGKVIGERAGIRVPVGERGFKYIGKISPEEMEVARGFYEAGVKVTPTGEVKAPYLGLFKTYGGPTDIQKFADIILGKELPAQLSFPYMVTYAPGSEFSEKWLEGKGAEKALGKYGVGGTYWESIGLTGEGVPQATTIYKGTEVVPGPGGTAYLREFATPKMLTVPSEVPVTKDVQAIRFKMFGVEAEKGGRTMQVTMTADKQNVIVQQFDAEGNPLGKPEIKGDPVKYFKLLNKAAGEEFFYELPDGGIAYRGSIEKPPYEVIKGGVAYRGPNTIVLDDKAAQELFKKYPQLAEKVVGGVSGLAGEPTLDYDKIQTLLKGMSEKEGITALKDIGIERYIEGAKTGEYKLELKDLGNIRQNIVSGNVPTSVGDTGITYTSGVPAGKTTIDYMRGIGGKGLMEALGPSEIMGGGVTKAETETLRLARLEPTVPITTVSLIPPVQFGETAAALGGVTTATALMGGLSASALLKSAETASASLGLKEISTVSELPSFKPAFLTIPVISTGVGEVAGVSEVTETTTVSGLGLGITPYTEVTPITGELLSLGLIPSVTQVVSPAAQLTTTVIPTTAFTYPYAFGFGFGGGRGEGEKPKEEKKKYKYPGGKVGMSILSPDLFSAAVSQAMTGKVTMPKFTRGEVSALKARTFVRVPTAELMGRPTSAKEVLKGLLG
jgi:uncharacterized spore protein YtfJ